VKNADYNRYVERFEQQVKISENPKVFFYTRLWDPAIASSYSSCNIDLDGENVQERIEKKRWEYTQISDLRAELVRALKTEFGDRFVGGISPSEYAIKKYPELIGDMDMSKRKNYTKYMHSAEVCVNTQGTHHCWNFSFGEELAAGRAVVTEAPFYEVPPHLQEGTNFMTYHSIEECVEHVEKLLTDKEALSTMMCYNERYYIEHLRPDSLVWDTIKDFVVN
jgi:hypothetical protein